MLPAGVQVLPLRSHLDHRGSFTEVFRDEWCDGIEPVQWNFVRSAAGAMRGVHVHVVHDDVVIALEGRATLGLRDVREASPTHGLTAAIDLSGATPAVGVIPHGVVHGLLFREPTTLLVGVTSYYDPADDLECSWSDPDLAIPWPTTPTLVSDRDQAAPPFSALLERIRPWQPFVLDGPNSGASSERVRRVAEHAALR